MGIYIKGIDLLTSGELLVIITPNGEVRFKNSVASAWDKTTAVPVPPHGRTIDADKLLEKLRNTKFTTISAAVAYLEAAPTVIPAEEGEI